MQLLLGIILSLFFRAFVGWYDTLLPRDLRWGIFFPISRGCKVSVLRTMLINVVVGIFKREGSDFIFIFFPAQSLLFCPKVTWKYFLLPSTADWRCRARTWSRRVFLTQQEEFSTSYFQIRKMVAQFLFCFASHSLLFREFPSCKNFSTYLSLPISSETAVAQKSCLFIGAGRHAQRLGGK